MNVRATSQAPPFDPRETEALAHALHGDPFRLGGNSLAWTGMGRDEKHNRLPGLK